MFSFTFYLINPSKGKQTNPIFGNLFEEAGILYSNHLRPLESYIAAEAPSERASLAGPRAGSPSRHLQSAQTSVGPERDRRRGPLRSGKPRWAPERNCRRGPLRARKPRWAPSGIAAEAPSERANLAGPRAGPPPKTPQSAQTSLGPERDRWRGAYSSSFYQHE